jgi:CDP-paratose 2-epimerase
MRILITGGAGFVGSNLALAFKRDLTDAQVTAFDNLKRRGSELAIRRLAEGGVEFRHGDVRNREDLADSGKVDLLLECSAEPSVQAGLAGGEQYLINTNLAGTVNCLDHARRHGAAMIFLSTSRVYPIAALRALPLQVRDSRYVLAPAARGPGWSAAGIAEDFPLEGSRSLYGATKVCAELIITEYVACYGVPVVVNRCGVLAGPWQMGKVDQGFVTLWAARHLFGENLSYHGFGGTGLQVRDVLHVEDLYRLLQIQLKEIGQHSGQVYNVGGGPERSISLAELTVECATRAARKLAVGSQPPTNPMDIPYYVSDNTKVTAATGWAARISIPQLLDDVFAWLRAHRAAVEHVLR